MYIKLTSDRSTTGYIERDGMYRIRDALNGGTSTSTPFVNLQSAFAGTQWTSGLYTFSASGNVDNGYLTIGKSHYAKNQVSGFSPSIRIYIHHNAQWGFRVQLQTNNGAVKGPNGTTADHFWIDYTANYPDRGKIGHDHYDEIDEIHIIANDTTFAIQVQASKPLDPNDFTDQNRQHGTFVFNDLEFMESVDVPAYGGNSLYYPGVAYWHFVGNQTKVNGVAAGGNDNRCVISRPQYIDQTGTYRDTAKNLFNEGDHFGYQDSGSVDFPTIEPRPCNSIRTLPGTNAETVNMLVPIYYMGHMDDTNKIGDPRRGRLMNWYRTSDNLGNSGDVILDGSTRYRLFSHCGKTGNVNYNTATENITYAFPEDNVPFA